jgi:hypothetical protein
MVKQEPLLGRAEAAQQRFGAASIAWIVTSCETRRSACNPRQ